MSWFRSNLSLKIASIVLALFLWMYVRTEEQPVQVFLVPLEFEGLPPDLALTGETLDSIAVRARAPASALRNLSPERFRATVVLTKAAPGSLDVAISPSSVRAPMGVEILGVDPQSVSLEIERRIQREVPVTARFRGDLETGFELDGYTLNPDTVPVEGPEGIVSQVREAVTEEVDLDGRNRSFETTVSLVPDHGGVRIPGGGTAMLRVGIREARVTREYDGVELISSLPPGVTHQVSSDPSAISVVLEGTSTALDRIGADNIQALLDLVGMSPREAAYAVKPRVVITPANLGAGVAVRSVSHETVSVRISP